MLGLHLDRTHPGAHSWTLALLVAGLTLGCANAWHWVWREDKAMHDAAEHKDE
jgi:ATP synthase protein I